MKTFWIIIGALILYFSLGAWAIPVLLVAMLVATMMWRRKK